MRKIKLSGSMILTIHLLWSAPVMSAQTSTTAIEDSGNAQAPPLQSTPAPVPGAEEPVSNRSDSEGSNASVDSSPSTTSVEGIPYPEITPGPSVDFNDAIEKSATRNLNIKVAQMEIAKAEADLKTSWGLLLPVLQGGVEYTHFDHEDSSDLIGSLAPLLGLTPEQIEEMNIGPLVTNPQEKVMMSLDARIPLVNLEGWFTVRAARRGVDAVTLSIETVKRTLVLKAAQAWFMALSYKDLIDFTYSQVVTCTEQLRVANATFNAGNRLRIDVVRAETDLAKARQSMISAVLSYGKARAILGNLMGMKQELPVPVERDRRLTESALDQSAKRDPSKRVDIRAQKAKISAKEKMLTATWMKFVPTLSLGGHFGYRFSEMPDMGSPDRSRWAMILSLTVPLYNHFRYGELDKRKAELKQAQLELENIRAASRLEVRTAQFDYETSLTSIEVAETQVRLASEGLSLTLASFEVGTGDSLSVTNARQTFVAAQFNLMSVQLKSQLALLKLLDAMGEELLEL